MRLCKKIKIRKESNSVSMHALKSAVNAVMRRSACSANQTRGLFAARYTHITAHWN